MSRSAGRKIGRLAKLLVPSGVREALHARRLRRVHGLHHIRADADQVVVGCEFGRKCRIGGGVVLRHSTFGDYTYIEAGCRITYTRIGRFCSIAPGSFIGLSSHPVSGYVSTHPAFYYHCPSVGYDFVERTCRDDYRVTYIGNDVWIGAGVCVRDGVRIGDGAVIAAGAVIAKDVPPYAIYGGVPAKLIRYRFDDETIGFLLRFRWWERDKSWLRRNLSRMQDVVVLRAEFGQPAAEPSPVGR